MGITFEKCCFCGKNEMRKEGELWYNQSQDIFYYVWRCYGCGDVIYEEAELGTIENVESKKKLCLWCQNWNAKAEEYNKKLKIKK